MEKNGVAIHWFRHGLRLHDMPSLHEVIEECSTLYPIFIFDGEAAGTKIIGYNRMRFLLESLEDLDRQFQEVGGRLYVFHGKPKDIFQQLFDKWNVTHLSFEQDPEPIWQDRDNCVREFALCRGVKIVERVSHTLWDPKDVIDMNGGTPPLTYTMFSHVVETIGLPPRPIDKPDLSILTLPVKDYNHMMNRIPSPEEEGIHMETPKQSVKIWFGGEHPALDHLCERLKLESQAYKNGYYLPNQFQPELTVPPMSMSAALRFGCLSVRNFYWSLHDLHRSVCPNVPTPTGLTGQLLWREYFYTMSVGNKYYDTMKKNPICLDIPWRNDPLMFEAWKEGKTGFPFIDAAMRQLKEEGWLHHVTRNAVACFLTRGDLWISWEAGLQIFLKYLIDADWSVCAGNWMWVSSSAFENVLQCSYCISPVYYGRRLEPTGQYIKRYVPELRSMPLKYVYQPWKAPQEVQEEAGCVIGKDYPAPIVEHEKVSAWNIDKMNRIREKTLQHKSVPCHCAPSSQEETRIFLWLPDQCSDQCS